MKTARIFISGFVQGVGFRYFVKKNAQDLGLTGWVRNTPDGRVEAFLQGSEVDIEKMIKLCRKGPFLSEVKDVGASWEDQREDLEGFKILQYG
ncbi:MAG: hypothetical protein ACD_50C00235G0006 [uncultured bacterium]|nr:MAG: hypothetical protein ACD_50C00235G0006 [uncultured bacterium]OGH14527.1 MAG: hypothetical protein A2687_05710 [Candidatus Levybacteria bacterium RIFCSPHIGHO2_01_FULL_38_26]